MWVNIGPADCGVAGVGVFSAHTVDKCDFCGVYDGDGVSRRVVGYVDVHARCVVADNGSVFGVDRLTENG